MADKYPNISPYAYCAWNPVKLVDPDGCDIWNLNSNGELIWMESSETDRIYARDGSSYIDMDDGVLTRGKSYTKESTRGEGYIFHLGDNAEKADYIFEFFADNADVEFSLLGASRNKEQEASCDFYLTCSFDPEGDSYGTQYAYDLSIKGTLRDATHNHVDGNMQPSGLPSKERIALGLDWSPRDKGDDVGFCTSMKMNLRESAPKAVFCAYIYAPKGKNPGMRKGGYTCYGSTNSRIVNTKYYKGRSHTRYSRSH